MRGGFVRDEVENSILLGGKGLFIVRFFSRGRIFLFLEGFINILFLLGSIVS